MNRALPISLCGLAILIDGYDVQAIGLAVPALAAATGQAPQAFGIAIIAGLTGMTLGATLLAPLADRFGRRNGMMAALALISVATYLTSLSPLPLVLAGWRFLAGLGLGALLPMALATTAEYASPARRTLTLTLVAATAGVGSFLAGVLAPLLESLDGWQALFQLGAILPLVPLTGMLLIRDVRSSGPAERPVSYGAAMAQLLSPQLRQRTVLVGIIFFISLLATYSLISWLPTLLLVAGWAPAEAQRATGFLALGGIIGGLTLAWLADRGKAMPALACAYVIAALSFAILGSAPQSRGVWIGLIMLTGGTAIGCQLALGALLASIYPRQIHATALGVAGGIGRAGSLFGPLVLTILIARQVPSAVIIGLLMLPMAACAVAIVALSRSLQDA